MSGSKRDRDRATEAFRRWARAGCPGVDQIKDVKGAEDLRACVAVFEELKEESDMAHRGAGRMNTAAADILRAVRKVYMEEPDRPMRKLEVTMRVRRLAVESYVSERRVYEWLARARSLWWRARK